MARIVGIDEVGRGCWAGPLVAAAVVLHTPVAGLKDSKVLTANQRENLAEKIIKSGSVGLGWVESSEIDLLGLTEAVRQAMRRALNMIARPYGQIIIDGNINFLADEPSSSAIIKADLTIPAVSAASIVAKVARDRFMKNVARIYTEYGFDRHVGYGTKKHAEMLQLHGTCRLHRLSYKPIKALATTNVQL